MGGLPRLISACLAGLALASPAAAEGKVSASTPASARIAETAGISVISPLILPTVTATSTGSLGFAGENPSAGTGGSAYGRNARLTIRQDLGEALSVTVPTSFTVVRIGGTEALTVNTTTSGQYGLIGDGILMSGAVMNGVVTSFDISGKLGLASARQLVPGPYEGLFAVIVEYN
jgi:hypothetical protein